MKRLCCCGCDCKKEIENGTASPGSSPKEVPGNLWKGNAKPGTDEV